MSAAAPEADKRRRLLIVPALRLRRSRLDFGFLVMVLVIAVAAPEIVTGLGLKAPQLRDPAAINLFGNPTGPGGSHPLGVDDRGRDVLSRLLYGLRSLVLISLGATALAALAGAALSALGALNPWLGWLAGRLMGGIRAYPGLLLGLALAVSLGGVWRLIIPIALVQLCAVGSIRELPAAFAQALAGALAIDVGLTFLGVGPGGGSPQLGAMMAQAGVGIIAGVPAWWALLFPGLAVLAVLLGAQSLARATSRALEDRSRAGVTSPGLGAHSRAGATRREFGAHSRARVPSRLAENPIADQLMGRLVQLIVVVALAAVTFRSLGKADSGGISALAGIGGDLGASGSLLLGGLMVWAVAVWLHLALITRLPRSRRRSGGAGAPRTAVRLTARLLRTLAVTPPALLMAAPAGWLAFLAIDVFSWSVGTVAVLPGAGTYVGLTHDPGTWVQSLIIPWLLLGLLSAAGTVLALNHAAADQRDGNQQRVARAAGVPEALLARQRRWALRAPLLAHLERTLPSFVATALLIEVAYRIPGVGQAILAASEHGRPGTVSDLTLLVTVGLIAAALGLSTLRILADPRAARR